MTLGARYRPLTKERHEAIATLAAEGEAAILANSSKGITLDTKAAFAIRRYLDSISPEWASVKKLPSLVLQCNCHPVKTKLGLRFRLCSKHRPYVARLFKGAGIDITLEAAKRSGPHRDLYSAGLIVGGGLPTLGKRR
jgi:hypothetical protein